MNSMLNYVIVRYIDPLLLGPFYIRLTVLLFIASVLSMILVRQYALDLWDTSKQLDQQLVEINSQLSRYQKQRDKINNDYERFLSASELADELVQQFSRASSKKVESWLIQSAHDNDLSPDQVRIETQLNDGQGRFFRITFKLSGFIGDIQGFLHTVLHPEHILIWEKIIFQLLRPNQLSLTIILKQYIHIKDENSVSS